MAGLDTLMQLSPYGTAWMAGEKAAVDERSELMRQQELAQLIGARNQSQRFQADKHPFELAQLGLANDTTSAQIPGIRAQSGTHQLNLERATATKNSDINHQIFKNENEMHSAVVNKLGAVAAQMENIPDIEKPIYFAQELKRMGVPEEFSQGLLQSFSKVPPDKLPAAMKHVAGEMLRSTPAYAQAYDTTSLTQDAGLIKNADDNRTNLEIARLGAGSREAVAATRAPGAKSAAEIWQEEVAKAKGSARNQHAKALAAAGWFKQNGDDATAAKFTYMAEELRPAALAELAAAQPKAGDVDIRRLTNDAIATQPDRSIAPPQRGAPGAKAESLANVQKMYPGVPAEKLREAYKKKFGVDLK